MDEESIREVDFFTHCQTCKSETVAENMSPCDECLEEGINEGTDKPVKWKPKDAQ